MSVIIMRGIPGSGKSTHAARLKQGFEGMGLGSVVVVSTDDFYLVRNEETGEVVYKFDITRLSEAHSKCLSSYLTAVKNLDPYRSQIIVDNTNTALWELAPYAALATMTGHDFKVLTILCDPAKAYPRNSHGVSAELTVKLDLRLREEIPRMPPHWKHEVLFG